MNLPYDVVLRSKKYYIQTWQYDATRHYPWCVVYLCDEDYPVQDCTQAKSFDSPDDAYQFMQKHRLG